MDKLNELLEMLNLVFSMVENRRSITEHRPVTKHDSAWLIFETPK